MLRQQVQESFQQLDNFRWEEAAAYKGRKFLLKDRLPQGPPPIGTVGPTGRIVPGGGPTVTQPFGRVVPAPQFHQGIQPHVQMPGPNGSPNVPQLLLSDPPDLFEFLQGLFHRPADSPVQSGRARCGPFRKRVRLCTGPSLDFRFSPGVWELWTTPAPKPIVTGKRFICHSQPAPNIPAFGIFLQSAGHNRLEANTTTRAIREATPH
jgi:hypothetical protein